MAKLNFDQRAVDEVTVTLDGLGLRRAADELVVVGGAAMAAFGIKSLGETDLDIAVTGDLLEHLKHDDRWTDAVDEGKAGPNIKSRQDTAWVVTGDYRGVKTHPGDVSAIRMPLNDGIYSVSSEELIENGVLSLTALAGKGYRFTRPETILDWKLALVQSDDQKVDKEKHLSDARLISQRLLFLAFNEQD